jgi:hypothetical protein
MVIAVGQGKAKVARGRARTDDLLRQWGSRMWTFPEVLLSPGNTIPIYTRGTDLRSPLMLSKNQFAARVWAHSDGDTSRQLIDHFLGTMTLSRLELAVLALECLYGRQTTEWLSGDQAYALMGLLRLRPQIDKSDSRFQAFARSAYSFIIIIILSNLANLLLLDYPLQMIRISYLNDICVLFPLHLISHGMTCKMPMNHPCGT